MCVKHLKTRQKIVIITSDAYFLGPAVFLACHCCLVALANYFGLGWGFRIRIRHSSLADPQVLWQTPKFPHFLHFSISGKMLVMQIVVLIFKLPLPYSKQG